MKHVVFIRRKKSTLHMDRHMNRLERELLSHTLVAVWITFMGHFFWISFGQSLCVAWFWVCIWYISGTSHVCMLTEMDSSKLTSLTKRLHTPLLISKEPLWTFVVRDVFLTLRMRNMWSLSLIWAGLSSSLAPTISEYVSTKEKPAVHPGAHLAPASDMICF